MQNKNTENIVKSAVLLAIAIVFQFIGRNVPQINQFLVGPIVNGVLLLTTYICGIKWGAITGALTPIMALIVGQLATPMMPFIPFIIIGNILYVLLFGYLKERKLGVYFGILVGSFIKFIFLFFSATKLVYLFGLNIPTKVLNALAVSMGFMQFVTAILGGIIAIIIISMLSKRKVNI